MENNFLTQEVKTASVVGALFRKTYVWMTLALFITAVSSLLVVKNHALQNLIYGNSASVWVLIIAEFILVIALSARLHKMSLMTASLMFIAYSILNGLTLSVIFFVYDLGVIYKTFFITAGTFAAVSVYGYLTKADLSKVGNILMMALFGLIIATFVNIFVESSTFDMIISYVGVIIFVGLSAWDTQKLKMIYSEAAEVDESVLKVALIGALTLYLDFINLFLFLLRIFGGNRDTKAWPPPTLAPL